jgi:hypothetical protein
MDDSDDKIPSDSGGSVSDPDDSNAGMSDKSGKAATDVSRWIKNTGALVGIFAALAGIWVSVNELKEKGMADQAAAEATLHAEQIKQEVAMAQIKDQDESRKVQSAQHIADNALELQKHRLDLQHEKDLATDSDNRNDRQRLSELVTHMFGNPGSSEGDIASLFEYLNGSPSNQEVVSSAGAIDYTSQANQSARRRYDDYMVSDFDNRLSSSHIYQPESSKPADDDPLATFHQQVKISQLLEETTLDTPLEASYVWAVINDRSGTFKGTYKVADSTQSVGYWPLALIIAVIERSNQALQTQMRSWDGKSSLHIDLRGTYLQPAKEAPSSNWKRPPLKVDLTDAFVELSHDQNLIWWPVGNCAGPNTPREATLPSQIWLVPVAKGCPKTHSEIIFKRPDN